jgi:hypothetical protein
VVPTSTKQRMSSLYPAARTVPVTGPVVKQGRSLFGLTRPVADESRVAVTIVGIVLIVIAMLFFTFYIAAISAPPKANEDGTNKKSLWGVNADEWFGTAALTFFLGLAVELIFMGSRMRRYI